MNTLTVTPAQLASLATAVHAASTDDITPVITAIRLSRVDDTVTAVATDRYRIARITLALKLADQEELNSPEFTALVPGKAFDAFARTVKRAAGRVAADHPSVTIAHDDDARTVTISDTYSQSSITLKAIIGNFPPVERLIPTALECTGTPAGARLNPAYLATMVKLTLPDNDKHRPWELTGNLPADDKGRKFPPVLFTYGPDGDSNRIEYLVQPNTLLR